MAIDKGTVSVLVIVGIVILFSLIVVLVPRETLPEASIGAPQKAFETSEPTTVAPSCKVVGDPSSSHTFDPKTLDNCPSDPVKVIKTQEVTVKGTYTIRGKTVEATNECTRCTTKGNEECLKHLKSDKNKDAAEAHCRDLCHSAGTDTHYCFGILKDKYEPDWITVQTMTIINDDGTSEEIPVIDCKQNGDGVFTCYGTFECQCFKGENPQRSGDSDGEMPGVEIPGDVSDADVSGY